jgi:hypothetical protein
VRVEGASTVYIREGQQGRTLRIHFCPTCGSSVHWDLDVFPDKVAVAVGAFADPAFPAPARSIYERSKHPWATFACEIAHAEASPVRR